jgi:hypothetical protein
MHTDQAPYCHTKYDTCVLTLPQPKRWQTRTKYFATTHTNGKQLYVLICDKCLYPINTIKTYLNQTDHAILQ